MTAARSQGSEANTRTLDAYEGRAERYRDQTTSAVSDGMRDMLARLAAQSPPGTILEIGSAHGRDARALEALGRQVRRTDATRAFVEMLRRDGHDADVLNVLTDPLVDEQHPSYAAVLANAVFLHFAPGELRGVLRSVRDVLVPGGLLGFTVKVGDGSEWSQHKLGAPRFFQYWQADALRDEVEGSGLHIVSLEVERGEPWDWLRVLAMPTAREPRPTAD